MGQAHPTPRVTHIIFSPRPRPIIRFPSSPNQVGQFIRVSECHQPTSCWTNPNVRPSITDKRFIFRVSSDHPLDVWSTPTLGIYSPDTSDKLLDDDIPITMLSNHHNMDQKKSRFEKRGKLFLGAIYCGIIFLASNSEILCYFFQDISFSRPYG